MPEANTVTDILGLGKVGEKGLEIAKTFLERILGPVSDEVGQAIADPIRAWRARRLQRANAILLAAATLVDDSGTTAQPVAGRILWPLLEKSSVEEDDELQGRWAALLANAAMTPENVLPGFPTILAELSPIHVRILDWMYQQGVPLASDETVWPEVQQNQIEQQFHLTDHAYTLLAADLHRLQLIDGRRHVATKYGSGGFTSASVYSTIGLTTLGMAFVAACKVPSK
jgi:hypothetical protein